MIFWLKSDLRKYFHLELPSAVKLWGFHLPQWAFLFITTNIVWSTPITNIGTLPTHKSWGLVSKLMMNLQHLQHFTGKLYIYLTRARWDLSTNFSHSDISPPPLPPSDMKEKGEVLSPHQNQWADKSQKGPGCWIQKFEVNYRLCNHLDFISLAQFESVAGMGTGLWNMGRQHHRLTVSRNAHYCSQSPRSSHGKINPNGMLHDVDLISLSDGKKTVKF